MPCSFDRPRPGGVRRLETAGREGKGEGGRARTREVPGSVGAIAAGGLLAGAEHEGREDREAGAVGGFGGVPDLV